jgi:NAD(P)-dependent dehydrogenase (short-subunit alcohol dehydrogenase family)
MNIIVTGASQGIGFETAKLFALDHQNCVIAIARGKEGLDKLVRECSGEANRGQIVALSADLLSGDMDKLIIPEIISAFSQIDILVNNAGMIINKPFGEMEERDFDMMFNSNVKSVFILIRKLLPYFASGSHIVNIGSMGGYQGSQKFAGLSLYSASKGALAILTECLAVELAERNIRTNCLALGSAQTEMLARAFPGYKAPLTAGEMAEFIVDFSLNGHRVFNGKVLPVALSTP